MAIRKWAPTIIVLGLLTPTWAGAEPSAQDAAAARALFEQGRKLAAEGKHSEACPKFEESLHLDPGIGALFNLADCHEKVGKTASAWSEYLQVVRLARTAGQPERARLAQERADALAPRLSQLVITVPSDKEVQGLEIRRDGTVVGRGTWGAPIPIDRGTHSIEASAPGRKKWTTSIEAPAEGVTSTISIPALDALRPDGTQPAVAAPTPTGTAPQTTVRPASSQAGQATSRQDASKPGSAQRLIGVAAMGIGVVGIGTGVYFGLRSRSKLNETDAWCQTETECWDQRGVDLHREASTAQTLGWILGGIGGAALVGGAALYFTAPKELGSKTTVGLGPGSVAVRGTF